MLKYLIGEEKRKRFRTVGVYVFAAWAGLIILRILMRWVNVGSELLSDAIFTIPMQIGLLLLFPFFMYKRCLKMDTRQVLEFSNVRKVDKKILLLAVPLGFCVFIATIGVSTVWQTFISILGYTHVSSASELPDKFNFFMFLASILLTAVLPAVCEEFSVRGGLLTVVKDSFKPTTTLVIMGVCFGLFHQNITQVFYTALFGAFMAFLTLRFKSLLPAVIVHFMNNGLSVYLEYAEKYNWAGGNFYDSINNMLQYKGFTLLCAYALTVGIGVGITILMLHIISKQKLEKKKELILDAGYDHTNNRVVLMGKENKELVEDAGLVKEVYGNAYTPDELFKPTLRDGAFYVGAIVLSVLITVSTFIWGLFY